MTVVSPMTTPVPWSMKKLAPMVAPGWMSMPVRLWAYSVMIRGMIGTSRRIQLMGQAVDQGGQQAGIAEDHLVGALGGRVAFQGGPDVGGQDCRDLGQGLDKGQRHLVALFLAVGAGQVVAPAVVADGHGDLLGHLFVEIGGLLADVVFEVGGMQPGPGEIAGKENAAGLLDDLDDLCPGGNGTGLICSKHSLVLQEVSSSLTIAGTLTCWQLLLTSIWSQMVAMELSVDWLSAVSLTWEAPVYG